MALTNVWAGVHDVRAIVTTEGSSALSYTLEYDEAFSLDEVRLHCNATPSTSENFTITLDSVDGTPQDCLLKSINMNGVKDYRWADERPALFKKGDKIVFSWSNTDAVTWGLTIVYRRVR